MHMQSVNLPRHGSKWKSANYGIEPAILSRCQQTKWGRCNTDFGISIPYMEYAIRNISLLIPCQEPSFSYIKLNL